MDNLRKVYEAKKRYRVYEFSLQSLFDDANIENYYEKMFLENSKEDKDGMFDNLVDYEIKKVKTYRDPIRSCSYVQMIVKEIYYKV